jgi:hypothetical protein
MASQLIKFGTLDLTEYVEELAESNDNRINIQAIANRHGGIVTDTPVLDARIIRMTGKILEDSAEDLRDTLASWETLLGTTRQRLYTMMDDRYLNAYKSKFSYQYIMGSAMKAVQFDLEFLADDPFEYADPSPSAVTQTLTTGDTSIGLGRYKKSFVINNQGNAYVFPTVVTSYTNTLVIQVIVRNLTLGLQFTYNAGAIHGMLQSGQNLTVAHGNSTILHSANGDKLTNFTGAFIYLNPGNNTLEIQGEPAQYQFSYEQRYY